ncbi:MAG: rRNA adenine N-6-methyltransferase family protein [Candidatus Altiarchaeota archaeon]
MTVSDQRFMVDDGLLDEIVGYGELRSGDVVLEVGAGEGELTEKIAVQAKVTAVENDHRLYRVLERRFKGDSRVFLLHGDALRVEYPPHNKIISNIPYSISRKLVERFILNGFDTAVLVVQSEFAKKLGAKPLYGNYRMVSVLAQSTCDVEVLRGIPADSFHPKPNVSSSVVRLKQVWRPPEGYLTFLNRLFSLKNKKIRNIMEVPGAYLQKRPCEMTPQEILGLYRCF